MKFQRHDLKLFTGNSNPELAEKISDCLGVPLSRARITHFADGEILVHVGLDTVRLNGEGFTLMTEEGREVEQGQPVMKAANNTARLESVLLQHQFRKTSEPNSTMMYSLRALNVMVMRQQNLMVMRFSFL